MKVDALEVWQIPRTRNMHLQSKVWFPCKLFCKWYTYVNYREHAHPLRDGKYLARVFVDLGQKGFSTVDHDILSKKLEHGVKGIRKDCFISYLRGKKICWDWKWDFNN